MTADKSRPGRFLTAEWRALAMANFQVDPAILTPYVPAKTEIDYFLRRAYVSIVGFRFLHTRVRGVPVLCHRNFDEVNLRFYVRRRVDGAWRRGVVFIKEIVHRRLIAYFARRFYNENYVVMAMRSHGELPSTANAAGGLRYEWHCGERLHSLAVDISGASSLSEPGSEEEFITEHYWGYSRLRDGATMEYEVEHPRWRVWKADRVRFDADAARLYAPEFAVFLNAAPSSALVADGSPVVVRRGRQL